MHGPIFEGYVRDILISFVLHNEYSCHYASVASLTIIAKLKKLKEQNGKKRKMQRTRRRAAVHVIK